LDKSGLKTQPDRTHTHGLGRNFCSKPNPTATLRPDRELDRRSDMRPDRKSEIETDMKMNKMNKKKAKT
jgi:hypothetical protein